MKVEKIWKKDEKITQNAWRLHEGFMAAAHGWWCVFIYVHIVHLMTQLISTHRNWPNQLGPGHGAMVPWPWPWTAMTWLGRISVFPCFSTTSRSSNCGHGISADLRCQSSSPVCSCLTFCDTGQTRSMWHNVTLLHFDHFCLLLLTFAFCFVAK